MTKLLTRTVKVIVLFLLLVPGLIIVIPFAMNYIVTGRDEWPWYEGSIIYSAYIWAVQKYESKL